MRRCLRGTALQVVRGGRHPPAHPAAAGVRVPSAPWRGPARGSQTPSGLVTVPFRASDAKAFAASRPGGFGRAPPRAPGSRGHRVRLQGAHGREAALVTEGPEPRPRPGRRTSGRSAAPCGRRGVGLKGSPGASWRTTATWLHGGAQPRGWVTGRAPSGTRRGTSCACAATLGCCSARLRHAAAAAAAAPRYYGDDMAHFDRSNNAPYMGWNPRRSSPRRRAAAARTSACSGPGTSGTRGTFAFRTTRTTPPTSSSAASCSRTASTAPNRGGHRGAGRGAPPPAAGGLRPERGGASMSLQWKGRARRSGARTLRRLPQRGRGLARPRPRPLGVKRGRPPAGGWSDPKTGEPSPVAVRTVHRSPAAGDRRARAALQARSGCPRTRSSGSASGSSGTAAASPSSSTSWCTAGPRGGPYPDSGNSNSERRPAVFLSPNEAPVRAVRRLLETRHLLEGQPHRGGAHAGAALLRRPREATTWTARWTPACPT